MADREAQIDAEDQVVIQLSHQIRALPGVTGCTLASPGDDPRQPIGLPPVVVAQCGDSTVVIERPGTLPGTQAVRRRIHAVREHHAGAAHVWFLRRDLGQFGQLRSHTVRLSGRDVEHQRVAPTEQQLAILDASGHVYWLDGKLVLVPYGYHSFRHPARPEQDWTAWPKWPPHKDPRDDWRISKPRPAPTADCWGLVPITCPPSPAPVWPSTPPTHTRSWTSCTLPRRAATAGATDEPARSTPSGTPRPLRSPPRSPRPKPPSPKLRQNRLPRPSIRSRPDNGMPRHPARDRDPVPHIVREPRAGLPATACVPTHDPSAPAAPALRAPGAPATPVDRRLPHAAPTA